MTVDDFVKIILVLAVAFSLVGVSFQIMRILGTVNDIMQDFRGVGKTVMNLLHQVNDDYHKLTKTISGLAEPIHSINENFVAPITELLAVVGGFATMINKRFPKRK